MEKITDVFTPTQLLAIGEAAMDFAKYHGPDAYHTKMVYEDAWFDVCRIAFPERENELIQWIQDTKSKKLPGEELGEIFYRAEQVVFGTSIAEYEAEKYQELQFSGYVAIKQAMARADMLMGIH